MISNQDDDTAMQRQFMILILLAGVWSGTAHWSAAQDPEDSADRVFAAAYDWIYDDLDAGLTKARQTGQPLMVVIRCPP